MKIDNVYIILSDINNHNIIIKDILSMRLKSSRFIPADSLSLSVIMKETSQKFSKIKLFINNSLFFYGIIDSQSINIENNIVYTSFECRSISALMLDNEVKPHIYFKLSSEQLIERHIKPFGIKGAIFPYPTTINFIQIKKGSSHWSVVDLFCKQQYNKIPFLKSDGFISVENFSNNNITFSNNNPRYINYISAKIIDNRYKIISKIFIKTGIDSYGPSYGKHINNHIAEKLNIIRERYCHPTKKWLKNSKASAEYFMKNYQRESISIDLIIPKIININLGQSASFISKEFSNSNLYVSQIEFYIGNKGILSYVKLLDKDFF